MRICYCALIFAADIVPSLSTIHYSVGLEKAGQRKKRKDKEKDIVLNTNVHFFLNTPPTDFDKNYIFGIGTSSAIEWYLPFLLSIS